MCEPLTAVPYPEPRSGGSQAEPLPSCCRSHPDWPTLSEHLLVEFPELAVTTVIAEVRRAKEAVDHVRLPAAEALKIGEVIARHQLMMRSGRAPDVARLDPEQHVRSES